MSFPPVFSTSSFVGLLLGLGLVPMVTATGRQGGAHGDPCGPSEDNSLICCHGRRESTLIRWDEQCCNGRPLSADSVCCSDVIAIPRAAPRHDSCCLRPGRDRAWPRARDGVTFDSRRQFCDRRTGRVQPNTFLGGVGMTNALTNFRGRPGDSWRLSSFVPSSSSFPSSSLTLLSSSYETASLLPTITSYRRALESLSSSSSLVVDPSSNALFPTWCQREGGRGEEGRLEGEELRCCGRVSYRPSSQTCCLTTLHDLPANQTQCCQERAFLIGDSANPCLGRCGSHDMDRNTQLCCDGQIRPLTSRGQVCCGKNLMNSRTHVCCGRGRVAVHRERGTHGCCEDGTLFLRRYTRCSGNRSGSTRGPLHRKPVDFTARSLCRRSLPIWGLHWPDVNVAGEVLHLEGQVTKVKKNVTHIHLTLHPFRVASPDLARLGSCQATFSPCTSGNCSASLRVIVDLRDRHGRAPIGCRGRQLWQYLTGDTLTTLSPLSALDCHNSRTAFLHVPSRSSDFLLLRKEVPTA